jgi:hypothetical protein
MKTLDRASVKVRVSMNIEAHRYSATFYSPSRSINWNPHQTATLHTERTPESGAVNSFSSPLTPDLQRKPGAYERWHRALDNGALRRDCPDAYHEELLRQSDEMDRQGIITWQEWRDLRIEADQAYLRAIAGDDFN